MIHVYINKKSLEHFGGILNGFTYASSCIDTIIKSTNLNQSYTSENLTPQIRSLVVTFERDIDISNLTSELLKGAVIEIDDGFIYECLLISTPLAKHLGRNYYEVSYTLSALQKGHEVRVRIDKLQKRHKVLGNYRASPIIIITPQKNINQITVLGITIRNLRVNHNIVIDSVKKLVLEDGINKFADTNLKKWPSLSQGEVMLEKSSIDVDVTVVYNPVYL